MQSRSPATATPATLTHLDLQLAAGWHVEQPEGRVGVQHLLVEQQAAALGREGRPELGRSRGECVAQCLHGGHLDGVLLFGRPRIAQHDVSGHA
jgi:hypothetical protein